ncbi:MAG TPA: acyltransferase family protein [Spongiibacteraceae bacterium]|nr:acyltransferase family protein [Spongiibacteraceae bacterium]
MTMTKMFTPPADVGAIATHPAYRSDIDGLRAVAVISVVGFHAFPAWIRGGFIGVDVFFVISGFLISTILLKGLQRGTYSIADFYVRRIVRIFPALIVMLIFCFVVGWSTLYASEYKQLGKHIAGGMGFISNFIYWQESGYFDNASDTKPLLHLWSLGIEEQFYVVWPLLLFLAWRCRANILALTVVLAIGSFVASLVLVQKNAVAAFYGPLARAWELMAGSLLAYAATHRASFAQVDGAGLAALLRRVITPPESATQKNSRSLLGFSLIVIGVVLLDKTMRFPGALALLPVLGAALIIVAGSDAWFNRKILSHPILVWFGLISFPLYLWHWPLLSFARIYDGAAPRPQIIVAALVASVVLAWLTYVFIERPVRFSANKKLSVAVLCFFALSIGYVGYNTYSRNGLPFRSFVKVNNHQFESPETFSNWEGLFQRDCSFRHAGRAASFDFPCTQDSRESVRYALIGDSKAGSLYPSLVRRSTDSRWLYITSFPTVTDSEIYSKDNLFKPGGAEALIDWLAERDEIKVVVVTLATRRLFVMDAWSAFGLDQLPKNLNYEIAYSGLNMAVRKMLAANKKVVVTIDNPTLLEARVCVQRKTTVPYFNAVFSKNRTSGCAISLENHLLWREQYLRLVNNLKSSNPALVIYDPTHLLCDMQAGECSFQKDGKFLYSYYDHISTFAASMIAEELVPLVDKLANDH